MKARSLLVGLYSGLWLGAIALSLWGLIYVFNHHPQAWDATHSHWTFEQDVWMFWFCACLGPFALLALRLWKWVLTLILLCFGHHELHKFGSLVEVISVGYLGYKLSQPPHHGRAYWRWLTKAPQAAGPATGSEISALRVAFAAGVIIWCLSAAASYPKHTTQPQVVQDAVKPVSYSQRPLVIHSVCVESTQKLASTQEPEVRSAFPADLAIHQEPDGRWYPDQTLADINRAKRVKHHARKHDAP
jgi:hypothetical protein